MEFQSSASAISYKAHRLVEEVNDDKVVFQSSASAISYKDPHLSNRLRCFSRVNRFQSSASAISYKDVNDLIGQAEKIIKVSILCECN